MKHCMIFGSFFGSQRFREDSWSWCQCRRNTPGFIWWLMMPSIFYNVFTKLFYDNFLSFGQCEAYTMVTPEIEDFLNRMSIWGQFQENVRPVLWNWSPPAKKKKKKEKGEHWWAQCQDNVIAWDIRSWCRWPGFPVEQHYKVIMNAHCHRTVPVLIWPWMLQWCKALTSNRHAIVFNFASYQHLRSYQDGN